MQPRAQRACHHDMACLGYASRCPAASFSSWTCTTRCAAPPAARMRGRLRARGARTQRTVLRTSVAHAHASNGQHDTRWLTTQRCASQPPHGTHATSERHEGGSQQRRMPQTSGMQAAALQCQCALLLLLRVGLAVERHCPAVRAPSCSPQQEGGGAARRSAHAYMRMCVCVCVKGAASAPISSLSSAHQHAGHCSTPPIHMLSEP